jgi:acetyl-CoA C-acetyltransferase
VKTSAAVLVSARRTPIGKFMGGFRDVPAAALGAAAARAALADAGVKPAEVDEALFGHGRQAGNGPNPARQAAIRAGLPETVPAWTVNKACGSGLQAILTGAERIALGEARIVLAGGMEAMSRTPFMLPRFREGYRLGHAELQDGMVLDGFLCPISNLLMGQTAEKLARLKGIGRAEQDAFAAGSQNKCEAARKAGRFADEIVPVEGKGADGKPAVISADEHPRDGVTAASLARLPPVFEDDGSVHAGNASGITDGGAAVVLMAEEEATRRGLKPLARLVAGTTAGVDPSIMGIGPVPALRKLFDRIGEGVDPFDLIEINEAFAAQVLACHAELPLPMDRVNVNGGAIALGHPIGATGARIVVTLLHEMRRRKARKGLATLCISGGMGMAVAFEAPI